MESVINIQNKLDKLNIIRYNTVICAKIEEINVKFLEGLKILIDEGNDINDGYYEKIDELSNLARNNLNIHSKEDYDKAVACIELADILITRGIKDVDEEILSSGFFNLKHNLNDLNIFS
ncbi:MAG: hypothetical protein BZ136_01400 [Methanosphaera sp. rholeuAM74]|nr:MAG: hypothetical protein BZ136_01400 [Methanosphaera sp. rholeuAM74]